jgi:hypothetical protein
MGPGDLTYPEHIEKGEGRYLQSAMQVQPDYSQINKMFTGLANMGPLVRGGQFISPQQLQQAATPGYLGARGQIAQNYLGNLFNMASQLATTGQNQGTIAAMIPSLQAAALQASTAGSSGLFGSLGL